MTSIIRLSTITLLLALFTACNSPQRGLKSVVSIGLAVERAMDTAGKLHTAKQITDADAAKLAKLFDDWKPLYDVALTLAEQFPGVPPGDKFREASNDLLNTAAALGVPLNP